jgi:hypothetical protein
MRSEITGAVAGGAAGIVLSGVLAFGRQVPLIGLTRGEAQEPVGIRLQRLGIHVLFGIALAAFAELGGDRK